jgi:endonuclease YncB( thermonuclease family)
LASTVAVLGLGIGLFLWTSSESQPSPAPRQVAAAEAAQSPSPKPDGSQHAALTSGPAAAQVAETTPPKMPVAASVITPKGPSPSAGDSLILANRPQTDEATLDRNALVIQSAPTKSPSHPDIALAPTPQPPKPAYQGKAANWMVADLLFVFSNNSNGTRPLRLFGIVSADDKDTAVQAQNHRKQLNAFIASLGGVVVCYDRSGGEYQCFAGDQDIAIWAVKQGLARLSFDAPAEYRQAVTAQ